MYKHILIATDGSEIAGKAVLEALQLAKALGAKVTAVTVTEPFEAVAFAEAAGAIMPSDYNRQCAEHAKAVLGRVTEAAVKNGMACETLHREHRYAYEGVILAAEEVGADLIVVGSHGRRGLEGFLLGSQAVKLLTHAKIPALVVR